MSGPQAGAGLGSLEFQVFLVFITLDLLVDAASEPGWERTWPPGFVPSARAPGTTQMWLPAPQEPPIPEPDPDFLSDSLKEIILRFCPQPGGLGTPTGWGVPVPSHLEQIPPSQGCWSWGRCSRLPQNPWMD